MNVAQWQRLVNGAEAVALALRPDPAPIRHACLADRIGYAPTRGQVAEWFKAAVLKATGGFDARQRRPAKKGVVRIA